jgi:GST-like protein
VHFKRYAPESIDYAINRYDFEAWRHWNILNEHLANHRYMVGNAYSIIDMAVWGWARVIPFVLGDEGFDKLPNVKRLLDEINSRPAAQRAEAIKTQHVFKTEVDDDARKNLFPQNARLSKNS